MSKPPRPLRVTLFALVVLFISTINFIRLEQAVERWDFLKSLLPVSPLYLAASGLVWGLLGLAVFWGIWKGKTWAPRLTLLAFGGYLLYYWFDRLWLASDTLGRRPSEGWPFFVGFHLIVFILSVWLLFTRKSRRFFGKKHIEVAQETPSKS